MLIFVGKGNSTKKQREQFQAAYHIKQGAEDGIRSVVPYALEASTLANDSTGSIRGSTGDCSRQ